MRLVAKFTVRVISKSLLRSWARFVVERFCTEKAVWNFITFAFLIFRVSNPSYEFMLADDRTHFVS